MVLFLKLETHPQIYLCVPSPIYLPLAKIRSDVVNEMLLPELIRYIAAKTDSKIISLFNELGGRTLSRPDLFLDRNRPIRWPNDGVHPNDAGYEVIAYTIAKELLK